VLAYAFLKAYPRSGFAALWIKPSKGFTGNHIVAVLGDMAFYYHRFFKLEPFARAHRGESDPLVARVVCSVDLPANGRSDLEAKVTRVRRSVASIAQAVPA
jgi:hypothetical protein